MNTDSPGGSLARATLLAALVCTLALATFVPRAGASAPRSFFGVVPQTAATPTDLDQMAANGVATMRVLFYMPAVEPGLGRFDWGGYDDLIASAATRGIRVIPTLYGTAGWLNFLDGDADCGANCVPTSDSTRNTWAAFAAAVAGRYGPGGEFWAPTRDCTALLCRRGPPPCGCSTPLPIQTYQIWNEQNSPKYFAPAPNVDRYARLLSASAAAIRLVDPTAEVITGGMWGPPSADEVVPTAQYVRQLYSVPGIESSFDAIAVHPYSGTLGGVTQQMKAVRKQIVAAHDDAGIWVTELGWASGGPGDNWLVKTPKGQARLLTTSIEDMLAKRRAWDIRGVLWYAWRDAPPALTDCEWCPRSGLRNQNGSAKPAARAFKQLALGQRR
ncbi:MAG: hypothetical protein ACJ75R_05130 [Solirubrobacterales bacterium]